MTVARPAGTRTTTSKSGVTYVQVTAEKRYHKDKKYNNDKRVTIGKMIDDTHMIPNENFFRYFPEYAQLQEAPEYSDVLKIGNYILMNHIFHSLNLHTLIDSVYGDYSELLKDIISYMVVCESSTMQHYPSYCFDHSIFSEQIDNDTQISKMFSDLKISMHDLFLEKWNQMHNAVEDIYISYDSTNMNTAASGANLVEYGKSKDSNSDLPQINVSIGFDQNNLTPLFYELYPGSVIDNTQCALMVDKVKKYGYKNIGFIIDRGYFSIQNIKYFIKNGYEYIIMAKANAQFVQKALNEAKYDLQAKNKYYISEHSVSGITVKYPFNEEYLKDQYMHVYYSNQKGALERESLSKEFARYDQMLETLKECKIARKYEVKKFEKYYNLKFQGEYLIDYSRKENEIDELIGKCGYFVIVTSKQMGAKEALDKYRHRDVSEKLFLADKTFLEADTIRVHSDESIESKELLNFISLIVRNEIYKNTKQLKNKSSKEFTIPAILRELDKIIITRNSKNQYSLRYALTKNQKCILEQFGIKEKDFRESALAICKRYSD